MKLLYETQSSKTDQASSWARGWDIISNTHSPTAAGAGKVNGEWTLIGPVWFYFPAEHFPQPSAETGS